MSPLLPVAHAGEDSAERAWLGLMSGTSGDGIDAARVVVREPARASLRSGETSSVVSVVGGTKPFCASFASDLRTALIGGGSFAEASRWDVALGERFAEAARVAIATHGPVEAIALSGHTFAHLPGESPPSTFQLGAASIVAERTGVPVLSGFRSIDVARAGEGAPLVPAGDRVLFGGLADPLAVVNVGGISNVTFLARGEDPRACDTGPGNLVLDAAHRDAFPDGDGFDRDGALAMAGTSDEGWLQEIGLPALPSGAGALDKKSTTRRSFGREEFGESWGTRIAADRPRLAVEDRLATLAVWVARAVALGIDALGRGVPPERILIGGGGAHHRRIVAELSSVTDLPVEPLSADAHGVSGDLREAAAFAILCHEWVYGRPGSFPTTSGARAAPRLGSWTLPGGSLDR